MQSRRMLSTEAIFFTSSESRIQLLVQEQWYSRGIFVMISTDQCRNVKRELRNMFNAVGTFVLRAEEF